MKYLLPIKDFERLIKRGREIERKQPTTPHEQYREFEKEKNTKAE
jgi:hypothetical protein